MNAEDKAPVRIAQVLTVMEAGGVEGVVTNYYLNIDHSRIQFDFLVIEGSSHIPKEIEESGGRIIFVPHYRHILRYLKTLEKIFRENQYPIVHSHMNTLSVFPLFAAWRAGVPIRIAHNHSTLGRGEWKKNLLKIALRPFAKIFPTHYCACSKLAGRWLFGEKLFKEGKIKIWKNAVDVDRFVFDPQRREQVRAELGAGNRLVVGHVGRLCAAKNHMFLLEVFDKVHQKRPDSILVLVGRGELERQVRTRVKELGLEDAVIMTGIRDDVHALYQAMDVFPLPSIYEGLPVVAVEAQISGLPMICSDRVTEETKISPKLSFLPLAAGADKWADAVLETAKDEERGDMRSCVAAAGYDIKSAGLKLTDWYEELIANEPQAAVRAERWQKS